MSTENDTDADFESAFAEAMGLPVEELQAEPELTGEELVTEEPVVVAAAEPVVTEPVIEGEPVVEPEPAAAAPVQDLAPIDPKFLAQAIAEAQEQQRVAGEQQVIADKAKADAAKVYTPDDFIDAEQRKQLDLLNAEWSEVAGPVQILINASVQAALQNQRRDILGEVNKQMAPIQQVTAQSQETAHYAAISAAHPDWTEILGALSEWIAEQPMKLATNYLAAYEGGTTAEVVKLLTAYKQAIGSTGAAPAQPASSAAQVTPPVAKPAPISKAALAATAAVPAAQRSTPVNSADPNDFEAGFREAMSATR